MSRPATEDAKGEPDYRFSLANERTFLAYVRTALAMMAAAVAVVKLVPGDDLSWVRRVLGVLLGLLSLVVAGTAYARYRSVQQAIEDGRPLPRSVALPVLGVALAVGAVFVVVLVVAR